MSHRSPSFREPSILNAKLRFFLVSLIRVLSFGFKKDYTFRPFTQTVDTGWTSKMDYNLRREIFSLIGWKAKDEDGLRSDILSLTGMAKAIGSFETPEYVLSMSYEQGKTMHLGNGDFAVANGIDRKPGHRK